MIPINFKSEHPEDERPDQHFLKEGSGQVQQEKSWHEARLDGLMEDNHPVPGIAPTLPSK
jgi:hypothetical protein